jgi:hypothetical protein
MSIRVSSVTNLEAPMNECFKHRTAGSLLESWTNAAMELLIAVGLVLLVVGTPFLFLVGSIYFNSPGRFEV